MFAQCFYRFICCLHFFLSFYGFLRQLHHVFPRANGSFYKFFLLHFTVLRFVRAPLLLFEKVEVATIAAVAKRFRARKTHFAQSAVGHVVDVAKQPAQLGATVFHASGMPQAVCYRHVEVVLAVRLRAFLQVGFAHVVEKNFAVYAVKPGDGTPQLNSLNKYSIPMLCPIVNSKQSFRSPNNTFYGSLRRQQQSSTTIILTHLILRIMYVIIISGHILCLYTKCKK